LTQITEWSDVIKEYGSGVRHLHSKLLSDAGREAWSTRSAVNAYYNKHLDSDNDKSTTIGLAPGTDQTVKDAKKEGSEVLDLAQWTTFADCWDHIVDDMRGNDLVSNSEAADLRFKKLTVLKAYGLRPLVMPCIFYAGKVQAIMDRAAVPARGTAQVLLEMYSLFLVLLKELNIIPMEGCDMQALASAYLLSSTSTTYHRETRESLVVATRVRL